MSAAFRRVEQTRVQTPRLNDPNRQGDQGLIQRAGPSKASSRSASCPTYDWLGLETAIPCHHDDIELPEIVDFAARVRNAGKSKVELLSPGEYFHITPYMNRLSQWDWFGA